MKKDFAPEYGRARRGGVAGHPEERLTLTKYVYYCTEKEYKLIKISSCCM